MTTNAKPLFMVLLVACLAATAHVRAEDDLAQKASWQIPAPQQVQGQVTEWLVAQGGDQQAQAQAAKLWNADQAAEGQVFDLLERVAATIALLEPRAQELLQTCRRGATPVVVDQTSWLKDEKTPPLVRNSLRLLVGRSLTQKLYFDEALQQLDGLKAEDVVDPASLLFYRSVAHHHLLHKEPGLDSLDKLLENEKAIPRRFAVLARLMRSDLTQIKDGSLDDISRRMRDIERRLGLGRANKRVRTIEDEVVEMLDKLIKEEEEKQCQACQSSGGGAQSSRPMPDSMPAGGKGPGQVTKRNIGRSAGWGELPPKQREETMQEIGRDFPAHYREVIEEYFRELARQNK